MCTLKPEKLAFSLKRDFFKWIFGLLKSMLNINPMLDTVFFPFERWNCYFEAILDNFWKKMKSCFFFVVASTKKMKSERDRDSAVTVKGVPSTSLHPPPPAEEGWGAGVGGARSSPSRLGVRGWGALFAVKAEPRSLSLFIFFVDANVQENLFQSFESHKDHW